MCGTTRCVYQDVVCVPGCGVCIHVQLVAVTAHACLFEARLFCMEKAALRRCMVEVHGGGAWRRCMEEVHGRGACAQCTSHC